MMMHTLTPAYGRDYKSVKAVTEDFNAVKDFYHMATGSYTTKEEMKKLGESRVMIRYKKLTLCAVVKI